MIDFRTESEHGLRELQEEFNTLEASHLDQVTKLEKDYHDRLDELVKRHETEVLQASRKDASAQDIEMRLRGEMDEKMQKAEEQYRTDLIAQEKKFKMQTKKNKEEFRKMLSENGVQDQVSFC